MGRCPIARQAQSNAQKTYNAASGIAGTSENNANAIFNQLMPQFESEVSNPTGIGPSGLAAENTAAQQSTGGSTAGAVGGMNQMAARTRNKGGFQIAGDEAARQGTRQNSQLAVENQAQNERLKQQQKQAGLAGEAGLYGQNMQEILGALGQETGANNSEINAGNSGWLQNTMGILNSVGNLAKGVSGFQMPGCWVAAELYGGWDDPRVHIIREWLGGEFSRSWFGRAVVSVYQRLGERMAEKIKHSPKLRFVMQRIFDAALVKALGRK